MCDACRFSSVIIEWSKLHVFEYDSESLSRLANPFHFQRPQIFHDGVRPILRRHVPLQDLRMLCSQFLNEVITRLLDSKFQEQGCHRQVFLWGDPQSRFAVDDAMSDTGRPTVERSATGSYDFVDFLSRQTWVLRQNKSRQSSDLWARATSAPPRHGLVPASPYDLPIGRRDAIGLHSCDRPFARSPTGRMGRRRIAVGFLAIYRSRRLVQHRAS